MKNRDIRFGVMICLAFIICAIILPFSLLPAKHSNSKTITLEDSINILNTMLLDCNNKFDNEITKINQDTDNNKSIDSIDFFKQNIILLKEQKLDLKRQLETSDKAWQYYQNQYYHCIDKLNNEIK